MSGNVEACVHCQISALLSLYYQALDKADLQTLESKVIASDATWEVVQIAPIGRIEDKVMGRDQVVAWFRQMLSIDGVVTEGTIRHFINTHLIRTDPDGQAARSTSHLLAVDTITMATRANGIVEAEHVRTADGWRIRSCKIEERLTNADMEAFKAALDLG